MKDIVIFGTGGFAREVHQVIEDINQEKNMWNFLGWLDGNAELHGQQVHGLPVLGELDWLDDRPDVAVVVAVGNTAVKRRLVRRAEAVGHRRFATLVHPLAWLGNRVAVGDGTVICAGTLVTTDIQIGNHVILNLDCTVGHDAIIDDFVTVAPSVNISGSVHIEEGVDMGTGSVVIQGRRIGHWSIIGAGAVVVRDIPANVTAVGAPAKPIKERAEGWQDE
jgi:sugar O-acyltransferase (sialic acid O-acetyltransferase NeuD family)